MTTAEILNKAADLIEPPGTWIQGWFAKDADGNDVMFADRQDGVGVCWCALGAIERVAGRQHEAAATLLARVTENEIGAWNDAPGRTQAEVVAALRTAAALAEGA